MKPFIYGKWHAWDATRGVLLSDEEAKKIRNFNSYVDCINWLFLNGEREAARTLNAHIQQETN